MPEIVYHDSSQDQQVNNKNESEMQPYPSIYNNPVNDVLPTFKSDKNDAAKSLNGFKNDLREDLKIENNKVDSSEKFNSRTTDDEAEIPGNCSPQSSKNAPGTVSDDQLDRELFRMPDFEINWPKAKHSTYTPSTNNSTLVESPTEYKNDLPKSNGIYSNDESNSILNGFHPENINDGSLNDAKQINGQKIDKDMRDMIFGEENLTELKKIRQQNHLSKTNWRQSFDQVNKSDDVLSMKNMDKINGNSDTRPSLLNDFYTAMRRIEASLKQFEQNYNQNSADLGNLIVQIEHQATCSLIEPQNALIRANRKLLNKMKKLRELQTHILDSLAQRNAAFLNSAEVEKINRQHVAKLHSNAI